MDWSAVGTGLYTFALQEEGDGQVIRRLVRYGNEKQAKNLVEAKDYRKLKPSQLASFCRELSILLEFGITLVRALNIISQQEGLTGYEREIYQAVLLDVKKSITLSEAMETKKCFPEMMIGMIHSGEGTGNLDQVTRRLAMQFEKTTV